MSSAGVSPGLAKNSPQQRTMANGPCLSLMEAIFLKAAVKQPLSDPTTRTLRAAAGDCSAVEAIDSAKD